MATYGVAVFLVWREYLPNLWSGVTSGWSGRIYDQGRTIAQNPSVNLSITL